MKGKRKNDTNLDGSREMKRQGREKVGEIIRR